MNTMLTQGQRNELIRKAVDIRQKAYAPYSNYFVGAALLTSSGKIYTGVNVENAAYSATICAERTAIVKAVSEGEKKFQAVAVATENGGSPCGLCRQVLAEFGLDTIVLISNADGKLLKETTVDDLLPLSFTPRDLAR
jgi:cytidine deaminase